MHRGSHHFGFPYNSTYSNRGYHNEDKMIEVVQQFREFKPYLKKRLAYIRESGRALELADEVEDIEFYLDVMKDILADESHGVDTLRSFIDKIHEMIRKNPLTEHSMRRSIDGDDEYGDDDRPRSPSPERRNLETATNIPLIPTHGAHEVNFAPRNVPKNEEYDEWGRSKFENSFTRREPYKDVDMRGGYYGTGAVGRGQRRWSEENDFNGARGVGRGYGIGRGAPIPHPQHRKEDYRQDQDNRSSRGRGLYDKDYDRRNDYHFDRHRPRDSSKERERDCKPPEWLTGGPSNGNSFDEWQPKSETRDSSYRTDVDRRPREDEWRTNHNEARERADKYHAQQHIAKHFERRPSSETRREERSDDFSSMYERRPRNDRSHDSSSSRHDMNSPHSDFNHGRRGHGDYHPRGRKDDERHETRSRMDGGPQYPPPNAPVPPLMNQMSSIPMPMQPVPMGYGVPQPPPHFANPSLLPPSHFTNVNPPLLPLPVPNAANIGMAIGMPPMAPGVSHPMGFQQPPPVSNFSMAEMHASSSGYRVPPPQIRPPVPPSPIRAPVPPSPIRTPTPHHPPEHYPVVPSSSPNYASPVEPSAEQVREITMMKAKQCFGRVVSRSPSGHSSQPTPGPSAMPTVSPGPNSPSKSGNDNQSSSTLDPRLNRARTGVHNTVQSRQQSPPAAASDPPQRASTSSRPDAGNVLRPSSDPRARSRIEQEKKRLQETRDRIRQLEGNKLNSNKGSKIQELRKQFEKEGFHRLGRPAPKKQGGSFEDALTAIGDEETDPSSSKPGDRGKSPSSSHSKEKQDDVGAQSRSQTDKTEKEKSPKKKGNGKEKAKAKAANTVEKNKDKDSTNERTLRRKSGQNDKVDKTTDKVTSKTTKTTSDSEAETSQKTPDPTKPPAFKIPRKPKPKEPEVEPPQTFDDKTVEVPEKDVCTSPPASPEPALSQVPDTENRTETIEDNEPPSTSAKPASNEPSSSSDLIKLESLKQFLMASADPEEREFFMSNPDNLKQFFLKIKSEMSAAKGSRNEESGVTQPPPGDSEPEKSQPPEDDGQERGRSREKKRNTKRRSSLEKLHDALKEMRFDTMLPLGPRRCTRGAQEEVSTETTEPEASTSKTPVEVEPPKPVSPVEKGDEDDETALPTKKRGRPPKELPKNAKGAPKTSTTEEANEEESVESEKEEVVPQEKEKVPIRRGKKRKMKPVKVSPRKRAKSGPITRAQAALKNKGKEPAKSASSQNVSTTNVFAQSQGTAAPKEGVTTRKKKSPANNVVMRRLTRKRVGPKDSVVHPTLCKIKLETDYKAPVKTEPAEPDPFLNNSVTEGSTEQPYLADQLANIINENLDNDIVANLDRQTEENMDLDVFNTLDGEETNEVHEVCVKDEMEISFEDPSSDPSYDGMLFESSLLPNKKSNKPRACPPPPILSDFPNSDINAEATSLIDNVPATSTESNNGLFNSTAVNKDLELEFSQTITSGKTKVKQELPTTTLPMTNDDSSSSITLGGASNGRPSPMDEDDSSRLSANSSCSAASAFKPDSPEDVLVKTEMDELMNSSLDDLRKDALSNKCDKCSFSGKKIVAHYVNKHYPCNIPQARLMPETFNGLIELNTSESPQLLEIVLDESQSPVWPCLYCDDRYDCIVDFYDHLTSHTGEFRYECGECGTSYPHQKSLTNHVKSHKGVSKNCIRFTFESVIKKSSRELSGFLCNDCFYFQLRFESIIRHIEETGHSSLDVKSVRLIRPTGNAPSNSDFESSVTVSAADNVPKEGGQGAATEKSKDSAVETTEGCAPKVPEIHQEPVNEKENECVFFGTNGDFTPPPLPVAECRFAVARVFKDSFLDGLMKKMKDEDDESESGNKSKFDGSKKRKRSGNVDTCTDKRSKAAAIIETFRDLDTSEESNQESEDDQIGVKIRTTIPKYKTIVKWDSDSNGSSPAEEPNNFLLSSDDESSDESEVSDESLYLQMKKLNEGKIEGAVQVKPRMKSLQNNEHTVKTGNLKKMEKWDESYFLKHELVTVRRSGDMFDPKTVLFGYLRPENVSKKSPHKLRDLKEVDKLNHVHGSRVLPVKCIPKLKEMITPTKLMHLFKCMSSVCSYTTNHPGEFLSHLNVEHFPNGAICQGGSSRFLSFRDIVMMKDADCCPYCSARYREARDLMDHVINQHSQSLFQCDRCFYRSYYQRYVIRHYEVEHPNENPNVLKCHETVEAETEEATLFQIFVYKCDIANPTCDKNKRFVFREDFIEHLEKCGPEEEGYPCHLCRLKFPLENIIEHYKVHNLFKFHCSYCAFGSEVKSDLDEHFVFVHPNTSGRVFYRVKPSPTSTAPKPIFPASPVKNKSSKKKAKDKDKSSDGNDTKGKDESPDKDKEGMENQASADNSGMDVSENEDNEKGRLTNLKGRDLYRCVTGDCDFIADNSDSFKEHVNSCSFVAESRSLSCAHCERKMKTATNLLEHMKVHGEKKQTCSLCSFRCWTGAEITKHIKAVHRVMSHKLIKKEVDNETDPDFMAYPKDVFTKSLVSADSFETNYYSFAKKALYSFDNIDKLPLNKIFSSDLNCAMCTYSTKVRSNMVRHLNIHKQAKEDGKTIVPLAQRINPVPYLSREGLEFDKMMNLAASSHKTDGAATESDVKKLPQFVKEQFRYVCSICDHITSDETLLLTHIKVIHSEVTLYKCPHCQQNQASKDNPDNTVPLDKISFHLKLHGPKLYKCGHCMVVHHQLRLMEKHIPEKHPEKKPIHYLIRDVDPDGVPSSRQSTSGVNRRQSLDDYKSNTEKWKCFLCSSKTIFGSWSETRTHCETVHKVNKQFMCLVCGFASDEVPEMLSHCHNICQDDNKKKKILVMFSKCETFDAEDATLTAPVWKKNAGPVRHIHGNFTEDSVALIKHYNNQFGNEQLPAGATSPAKGLAMLPLPVKKEIKPTTSTSSKARRSTGVSPIKSAPLKPGLVLPPPPPIVVKPEVFKYRCHKCDMYKTKSPAELRIHLFNEFRYKRWMCLVCNLKFCTEKSLKGHIERDHQKTYQPDLYELQPENVEIEGEIDECIEKQNRKKEMINSFSVEKFGKLTCKHCKEDGYTYDSFETHILERHSS